MDSFGRRFGWILGATLCAILMATVSLAAEKPESELVRASNAAKKKAEAGKPAYTNEDLEQGKKPGLSYTNEDLSRMFGASADESKPGGAEPRASGSGSGTGSDSGIALPDPLTAMQEEKDASAAREQRIAEAESALAAAEAKLKSLEVQLLATRNPFSARPQLSEEEQAERVMSDETAAQRNARTQKMVDDARLEVTAAQAALSQARAQ
jgi:hypothetical protein